MTMVLHEHKAMVFARPVDAAQVSVACTALEPVTRKTLQICQVAAEGCCHQWNLIERSYTGCAAMHHRAELDASGEAGQIAEYLFEHVAINTLKRALHLEAMRARLNDQRLDLIGV